MANFDLTSIIEEYLSWLRDNSAIRNDGGIVIVTTPFLDSYNDHIELIAYHKPNTDKIIISDDGRTINNLAMQGVEVNSDKRKIIFNQIINGLGVHVSSKNELYVECEGNTIGQKKHKLLQAILAVGDMYILSRQNIFSIFKEEVSKYFDVLELYPSVDIRIPGKSGYDHMIDFVFNPQKQKKECLIKAINNPKKDTVTSSVFSFIDILDSRKNADCYVILNDTYENPNDEVLNALTTYNIKPLLWSQKEQKIPEYFL